MFKGVNLQALCMRILAVWGIEVTACVTILARNTRRPPPVERAYTQGGEAPKSSKEDMRAGPPAERSLRGQAARHQGENDR